MTRAGLMRLGVWLVILLVWEGAYRILHWDRTLFPSPLLVIDEAMDMLNVRSGFGEPFGKDWPKPYEGAFGRKVDVDGRKAEIHSGPLITASLTSAIRLAVGFAISIVLGGLLGAAMWRLRDLDEFLGPLFLGFQTLPSVCWVPLGIIFFGLRETGILFVLVMGSFFAIALALRDGLRTIPPAYRNAGRMLGARGWKLYRYVLLPASLPAVAASLRQGFSFAWRSLMGAELILAVTNHGLGFELENARNLRGVQGVIAVMTVMVVFGIAADRFVFARLERKVLVRFGLVASS